MASKQGWQFGKNPFLSATHKNYSRAQTIGNYTYAALLANQSNPNILPLFNLYKPIYEAYESVFMVWESSLGMKKGSTQTLKEQMKTLVAKARKWDVAIQNVFAHDTAEYKTLMPHGRSPFNRGGHIPRINAVAALETNLTGMVPLAALKAEVSSFHTALNDALGSQNGHSSASSFNSKTVEIKRKELCRAMFMVLGMLIYLYPDSQDSIASYFDLQALRQHRQKDFNGHLAAGKTHIIARRTLKATETLQLINKGNSVLRFFLAANKSAAMGDVFVELQPHSSRSDVLPSSLGDDSKMRFYCVHNMDAHIEGEWEMVVG
jgi:hypothetical protein